MELKYQIRITEELLEGVDRDNREQLINTVEKLTEVTQPAVSVTTAVNETGEII